MEQQLCVFACQGLGEIGALFFAALAFVYGMWQRSRKRAVDAQVTQLATEARKLEAEIKLLSLRPPPTPVIIYPPTSTTPSSTHAEEPTPDPPPDETLG